jgi:hypothetical protein
MGIRSLVLALLLTAGSALADVSTISFASLSQPGNGMIAAGGSVTQDGFTFSSQLATFDVWGASSPNLPGLLPANTSLFEFFAFSKTTLTDGGAAFTLNSIDLAPVIAGGSGTFTVTFTGTHPDSSTVSQTFTVNDGTPPGLQTFDFSGFSNLTNVTFTQGTNGGFFAEQETAYQFDNVSVANGSVSTTPEPELFPILSVVSLGLVAFSIKRAIRARSN